MRPVRYMVLTLIMIMILSGTGMAQNTCNLVNQNRSNSDLVRVATRAADFRDTIWIPVELANDSIVTAFQFLIRFDTLLLAPVMLDQTYMKHRITSARFQKLDTLQNSIGLDSIVDVTQFNAVYFNELFKTKRNVIAANFLPTETDPGTGAPRIDTLKPGKDVIFELAFTAKPALQQSGQAVFNFYTYEVISFIDSTVFPPDTSWANACATAQMTTMGRDINQNITMFQIYPRINYVGQLFIADSNAVAPPQINSFSANPATVNSGSSTTLSWQVAHTDSVVISRSGVRLFGSPTATSYSVTPPTAAGQYSYTLTAYGGAISVTASTTVTVGTVTGTPPNISLNPNTTSYTLNQGETISFTITAAANPTNASEQVTITASNLANNMTFGPTNPVSGAGSVTGTFSFTPDLNQSGTFSATFSATDADNAPAQQTVVFNVNELLFDRLFSTSTEGQKPVGGLPGTEGILWPINLITSQTVYGIQFDMTYPYQLVSVDSFVPSGRIPEWVVYDNVGQTPGQIRVVTFGLANEPMQLDTTSAVLFAALTIDSAAVPWENQIIILDNGRESVNPDPMMGSLPLVTESGIVEVDNFGDVNLDRFIDVGDAVNIVAYVIGNFGLTPRQFATADLIISGEVNVFDLIGVVNLIYGIPLTPGGGSPVNNSPAVLNMEFADLVSGGSDIMTLSTDLPEEVAGVQLEFAYDPGSVSLGKPTLTDDNAKFSLSYKDNGNGQLKIIMYHLAPFKSNELMQIGQANLVNIPIMALTDVTAGDKTKLRLTQALLATSGAGMIAVDGVDGMLPESFTLRQNYPNPFNPTTTIEFEVSADQGGLGMRDVRLEVFNVLGQKVNTLVEEAYPVGTHQVVWDATDYRGQRVATGIYLYRLVVGSEHQTKKMLFLK